MTVVFSHYLPFWDRYLGNVWVIVPNSAGGNAVRLFFVISGFVIFMTLDKCRSVLDFALMRFSRLYPAYWVTLFLATFTSVVLFGKSLWFNGLIVNTTMFQEFLRFPNFDNVYWSLTVELAFYVNAAWVFALGLHRKVVTCSLIWLTASGIWALTLFDPTADVRDWFALLFALDFAPFFVLGILLFNSRNRKWRPAEIGLVFLCYAVEFLIGGIEGVAVALAASALMLAALSGKLTLLTGRATLWLGAISYSLYLIHRNVGYNVLRWLNEAGFGPTASIAATVVLVVCLAACVTFLVEIPASRFLRSRWSAVRNRQVATVK